MNHRRTNETLGAIDVPNLDQAVIECVRYIICREGSKIPIRRAEIEKHLANTCSTTSKHVNTIVSEASNTLKKVYGYKLIQLKTKSEIKYMIILNEECESLKPTSLDPNYRRLLISALVHIFMTGGPVKEEDMWKFLSEAGVLDENDQAGRKMMTKVFTRQMYLTHTKVGEGDMARTVFEWGQRATDELPKMFVLNKMAEAFERTPDYWCEQYKAASEDSIPSTS